MTTFRTMAVRNTPAFGKRNLGEPVNFGEDMTGHYRYRTGRHGKCISLPFNDQRERPPNKAASNFMTKPDRTAAVRRSHDAGTGS